MWNDYSVGIEWKMSNIENVKLIGNSQVDRKPSKLVCDREECEGEFYLFRKG